MRLSALVPVIAIAAFARVSAEGTGYGTCKNIHVRREWRSFSIVEQRAFVKAVQCLGNKPHGTLTLSGATPNVPPYNSNSSLYDDFVYTHIDSNIKDHFTALFLAWHRWYIHHFEFTLKKECGYKGALPFWDWSKDTTKPIPESTIFNANKLYGLGTLGSDATNFTVTDGAFWNVTRAYPTPHVIKRNYTEFPFRLPTFPFGFINKDMPASDAFTPQKVDELVMGSAGNYTNFQYMMDGVRAQGMHNAAHLMMQGDLGNPLWSPNDVLFWLHHGNLDCIWARWQANKTENAMAYGGGLTQNLTHFDEFPVGSPPLANLNSELPTAGLAGPKKVYVRDMMRTTGKGLCYRCAY